MVSRIEKFNFLIKFDNIEITSMQIHKLKKIREARGYSQEYIASLCSINQSSYSRLESGKIKLDLAKIKTLALALEFDFNELLHILLPPPPLHTRYISI